MVIAMGVKIHAKRPALPMSAAVLWRRKVWGYRLARRSDVGDSQGNDRGWGLADLREANTRMGRRGCRR